MPASRRLPPRRGAGGTLDPACVRPLQPRTPEDSQLMWRVDTHGVYRSPAPKPDAQGAQLAGLALRSQSVDTQIPGRLKRPLGKSGGLAEPSFAPDQWDRFCQLVPIDRLVTNCVS
jgi:hypothetical protein